MGTILTSAKRRIAAMRDGFCAEHGQTLIVITGAMLTFTVFVGAVVDVGIGYEERRQVQNAVDAASLAAARAVRDDPAQAIAVAEQYLLLNGVDPADPNVTITIDTNYAPDQVAITVDAVVPTAFFRVINVNSKNISVRAVGQALPLGTGGYAMVSLSETACDAFLVWGNPDLTIAGGGIMVNSDCPAWAGDISGNATLSADSVDYFDQGGFIVSGNAVTAPPPNPLSTRAKDPLVGLAVPTSTPSPDSGGTQPAPAVRTVNGSGAVTLRPGTYWGGLNILGNVDVTFDPGVYVMAAGDFETWGNGSITGTGVTIYLTGPNPADCGQISMYGNRTLDFTPPTTGPYTNITFWQDAMCTSDLQYHGNVTGVHGVIYAPGARFDLMGNVDLGGIQVLADTISLHGNVGINMNFTSYVGDTGKGKISLTE